VAESSLACQCVQRTESFFFVSSIRDSSFPPMQNPGGPTQIYRFTTAEEGAAKIEIPHTGANPTFKLTIQVIAP
jgi:hypothetical protein